MAEVLALAVGEKHGRQLILCETRAPGVTMGRALAIRGIDRAARMELAKLLGCILWAELQVPQMTAAFFLAEATRQTTGCYYGIVYFSFMFKIIHCVLSDRLFLHLDISRDRSVPDLSFVTPPE